jgi:hypothetical protein
MMRHSTRQETRMRKTALVMTIALLGSAAVCAETDAQHKPGKQAAHKAAATRQAAHKTPPAAQPAAPKAAAEAPMGQEELSIAQRVHQGNLPCELGAAVRIEPDQIQPGYFNVQGKGFRYRMHPVATSTGAIRLEDKQAGAVWLQLANKSMLMDQKKGQRVADECAHPDQMAYAAQMKNNPPPPLIEVNTGR